MKTNPLVCNNVNQPMYVNIHEELKRVAEKHGYPWRIKNGQFEIELIEFSEKAMRIDYYGDGLSSCWVRVCNEDEFRMKTGE